MWGTGNLVNSIRRFSNRVCQPLVWEDDTHLTINGVNFHLTCDTKALQTGNSTSESFLLGKPRAMVEQSVTIGRQKKIKKIFEMGILQGGSVVLYDQIFQPEKIVSIEYMHTPVEALTRYIAERSRSKIIKPYYGINQADPDAMNKILSAEFPDRDVDIIIDDASHLYDETRQAFNIGFPYLQAGGLYVIEDWAWAHWSGDYWQKDNAYFSGRKALSNLLIELFMLAASRPDFIEGITVTESVITVTKGHGALPESKFEISDYYLLRGKKFDAWL